jgi:hypothetical protein
LATTLPRSCDDRLPSFTVTLGLIQVGPRDQWILTPAGQDLLATIPHLPPEPEPVAAVPACSRCNGETTVPLFMGPMSGGATMPCPECANGDGSPKAPPLVLEPRSMVDVTRQAWLGERLASGLVLVPGAVACPGGLRVGDPVLVDVIRGDARHVVSHVEDSTREGAVVRVVRVREAPDGWTLIDSEETARSFVGATVVVDAAAGDGWDTHPAHESTKQVIDGRAAGLLFADGMIINWSARGNVRLRRVAP